MILKLQKLENRKNNQAGFSIVELIVSVGLFSIILVAITASLLSVIRINQQAALVKDVMNNLDFALENMVRSVRTGNDYDCGTEGGSKNCATTPDSSMSFKSQGGILAPRIYYKLENGAIMQNLF